MRTSSINPKIASTALTLGIGLTGASLAWAAGGGEHGAIDHAKIMDLVWRVMNFAVFAAILAKLAVKPIKQFFASRKEEIASSLEDLEQQKAAANKALRAAKAELATVEAQRDAIIQQFVAEGEAEKDKIIQKAELTAERIKEMAALTIAQEVRKSAAILKQEIVEAAVELSEKMLKENIVPEDQQRLVDDYLIKVVEAH